MKIAVLLRAATLLVAGAFPLLASAQFQQPTPDELKMTSDPKAPGAAAVYLNIEEIADDNLHYQSYYARIKVLTEKGKELATVRVPYVRGESKVVNIEGRTIHPDGTVIPLDVKPEDLVDLKAKHLQVDTVVFTLPSVETGSILEYRLEIKYKGDLQIPPTWNLQLPYFVHKEHFLFHPVAPAGFILRDDEGRMLNRLMWTIIGPTDKIAVKDEKNTYTIDLDEVPPVPDEDWMPPLDTVRWQAGFYYSYALNADAFWTAERTRWSSIINTFTAPTDALKKIDADIVLPQDSDAQKARKLYAAVMQLDNTDFSREKSAAERKKEKIKNIQKVEDVWTQHGGPGYMIALLYAALARAAGLKAYPMQVVDRDSAFFDVRNFNVDQLDDYVVVLALGGKDVYTDPSEKMCPFGSLEWKHTLAGGFRETDAGAVIAQTPTFSYKTNTVQCSADLSLDAQGNVKGMARVVMTGAEALYWRQLSLENGADELKKEFEESIDNDLPEGVKANFDHFLGLDDAEDNLMAVMQIAGRMGFATGKRYFLPGLFFETRSKHPFVAEARRITPIDVHYPRMETEDVTFHLPAGYAVESAPTGDVKWPGFAVLHIASTTQGDSVDVVRDFGRNFTLLGPEAYNNLHDFYLKLAAADQQEIVLKRVSAAKGN